MKTTKMLTRKTIYILAAILGLQFNTLFAAVNFTKSTVEPGYGFNNAMLMPSTPSEATFEDVAEAADGAPTTEINLINLAPVTPKEADFEDGILPAEISPDHLAPVTPREADFEQETIKPSKL